MIAMCAPPLPHLATLALLKIDLFDSAHERPRKRQKVYGEIPPITSTVDPVPRDIVPEDMQMGLNLELRK
jgi:hypothetical protein